MKIKRSMVLLLSIGVLQSLYGVTPVSYKRYSRWLNSLDFELGNTYNKQKFFELFILLEGAYTYDELNNIQDARWKNSDVPDPKSRKTIFDDKRVDILYAIKRTDSFTDQQKKEIKQQLDTVESVMKVKDYETAATKFMYITKIPRVMLKRYKEIGKELKRILAKKKHAYADILSTVMLKVQLNFGND